MGIQYEKKYINTGISSHLQDVKGNTSLIVTVILTRREERKLHHVEIWTSAQGNKTAGFSAVII